MDFRNVFCTLLLLFVLPVVGQSTLELPPTTATEKKDDAGTKGGGINLGNSFFLSDLSQGNHQTILDFSRFGGHLPAGVLREALLQEWQGSFGNPRFRTGSNAGRGWGIRMSSQRNNNSTAIQVHSSNNKTHILLHDAVENSSSVPLSSDKTNNTGVINGGHHDTWMLSGPQRNTDFQRNNALGVTRISIMPSNEGSGTSKTPSSNTPGNTLTETFSGSNAGFPRSRMFDVIGGHISDSPDQGSMLNSGTSFSGIISVTSSPIQSINGLWQINTDNGTSIDTGSVHHPIVPSEQRILSNDSSMPGFRLPISESRGKNNMHNGLSFGDIFTSLFGESATQVPNPLGETLNGRVSILDDWNNTRRSNTNPLLSKSVTAVPQKVWPNFQRPMPSRPGFSDTISSENSQQRFAKDILRPALVDITTVTQNLQQKRFLGFPVNDSHIVFAGGPRIILTSPNTISNQEFLSNNHQQTKFDSTGPLMGQNAEMQFVNNTSKADANVNILSIKDMHMDSGVTGLQNMNINNGVNKMNLDRLSLKLSLALSPSTRIVEEMSKSFLNKDQSGSSLNLVQSQNDGLIGTTSSVSSDLEMTLLTTVPTKLRETFGFGGIKSQDTRILDNMESGIKSQNMGILNNMDSGIKSQNTGILNNMESGIKSQNMGILDNMESGIKSQNTGILNNMDSGIKSQNMGILNNMESGIKSQNTGVLDNMDSAIKREPDTLPIPNKSLPKDANIANSLDNRFHSKEQIVDSSIFSQVFKSVDSPNKVITSVETGSPSTSVPNLFDSTMKKRVQTLQTTNGNQFKTSPQFVSMNTQPPSDSSIKISPMTRPLWHVVEKAVTTKETMGETKLSPIVADNIMKDFPTFVQVKVPSLSVPDEAMLQIPDTRTKGFTRPAPLQVNNQKNNRNFFTMKKTPLNPNSPQILPMGFRLIQGSWDDAKATNEVVRNEKTLQMNRVQESITQIRAISTGGQVNMQPTQILPTIKMMKHSTAMLKRPISTRYMTTTACD